MPNRKLNLVLIPEKRMTGLGDFRKIAEIIKSKCNDVIPHVVKRSALPFRQLFFATRPSLYVAFYEARQFKPFRGLSLHGIAMKKSRQYLELEKHGVHTVPWRLIKPDEIYKPADWGPYVIVKPDEGRRGHDVKIRKTGRISHEKDCPDGKPHLIQKFVHTGPQPVSYRALTFFGETIYLHKSTNTACGNPLNDPTRADEIGGHNPVATAAHGRAELVIDEEVIAFAKRIAHSAFKDIPLLGQDIVRDIATGRLYCLEVNPYGSTWHFSSPTGLAIQSANEVDFEKQFDAFNVVADILILKTRELAR